MRESKQRFLRGINRRFPIQRSDDPDRLYTLQNARLFTRNETGFISRIKGFFNIRLGYSQSNILDIVFFGDLDEFPVFSNLPQTGLQFQASGIITKGYTGQSTLTFTTEGIIDNG